MTAKGAAPAATLNREIVDDRDGRLSIHTQEIRLTQAHLPYQPVAGKRLPSAKHFTVFADRIVLSGLLQNPGRNIELNAREIVIETPAMLDVGGAHADKDFTAGEPADQKDAKPGAAGTDGADGTTGGGSGDIVINARLLSNAIAGARPLSATEMGALGARVFSEHPPKLDSASGLGRFEIGKIALYTNYEVAVTLEDARIEGFAKLSAVAARFDGSTGRIAMRLSLPELKVTAQEGNRRVSSEPFGCTVDATAKIAAGGKVNAIEATLTLASDKPIAVKNRMGAGVFSDAALETLRKQIAAHLRTAATEPLMHGLGDAIGKTALMLLAGGGPGGRGQDGHAGVQGERGENGAKTSKHGVDTGQGYGFPEEAQGKNGHQGGQGGSPGTSGDGGTGGRVALNVLDPAAADIVYDVSGGDGGVEARAGARGAGGPGGQGAVCKMFNQKTGRPVEDQKAPDGQGGPEGSAAKRGGKKGTAGKAGAKLEFNGKLYAAGQVPTLSFAALAQSLSLSQLLIAQNAADMAFLNAKTEADLASVSASYSWLIDINQPFTGAGIDAARVSAPEQKVRAGMHNSAMVSLMRLQQGLDFYGHTYNWTPVLSLKYLAKRTGEMITIGEVIQEQYEKYLKKGETDANRLAAFKAAKEKIDTKVKDFDEDIAAIKEQIESFRTEIADCSEDIALQRTVLLEGQLKFKDQLIKHLREESELSLTDFLDMLGTVVGCVGGMVGGAGGVKTAIEKVKKAIEFKDQVKGVVEVFKKAKATIDSLKKAYSSIKELADVENPNAVKIAVDGTELDDMLKKYLGKFDAAGELRKALDHYLVLCQARNMAAYNYTTQVAQLLTAKTQRDQLFSGIQHINAEMAAHQDNVLPVYTAYLRDAYEDAQRDLLRNIYLENRAYQYWSLKSRPLETENLNVATLADTHRRLVKAIDGFREENEEFDDFHQELKISAEEYPDEFAALPATKSLAFALDIRDKEDFENMSYIIARSFKLVFPDIVIDPEKLDKKDKRVLSINLIHGGQAVLNSNTKRDKPGALHVFSHRPRVRLYKIDYRNKVNTAGGSLGDNAQGYIGLSPFTLWRIDFDLDGNTWLDLKRIKSVELTFEGRMLGPGRKLPGTPL